MSTSQQPPVATLLRGRPLLTAVAYVFVGILPLYLTSSQVVSLDEALGLTAARLGIATALHFGAGAAASRSVGSLVERVGARTGLQIGCALAGGAALLAASAPVWWVLLVVTSIGGVANGFMQVSTNVYLARDAAFRRQGMSFGAKQGAIPLGNAMAGLLLPVVGVALGWRWPYVIAVVLAAIAATVAPPLVNAPTGERADAPSGKAPVSTALRWMALGGICGGAAGNALALFVVPWTVDRGVGMDVAGLFLASSAGLVFVLRVAAGWFADRRASSGHPEMIALLAMGAVACATLATAASTGLAMVAMTVAMLGAWGWPGLVYFTVVRIHPEMPARASGVVLAANLSGTMLGPIAVGLLADRGMYGEAWAMCGVLSAIGAAAMTRSRIAFRRASGPATNGS